MQTAKGTRRSLVLALAIFAVTVQSTTFSSDWATDTALGSIAVSFDGKIRIYYELHNDDPEGGTQQTEELQQTGTNSGLKFDNDLNLIVVNANGLVNTIVRRAQADPHVSSAFPAAGAPGSLAFAADGTLYAASPGGKIRRYSPTLSSFVDFTVAVNPGSCVGIDLGADSTTLYMVFGGRHVFMLPNAHTVANGQVVMPSVFTPNPIPGQGDACGITLVPPQRGSSEKRHGGMFIADRRKIERLNAAGVSIGQFKSSIPAPQQNWIDVAVDPRLVFDSNNPPTGVDPDEWGFWGIDADQRIIARYRTDAGQAPLQTVSTGPDVPRGLAVNGGLYVAQRVKHVLLTNGAGSVSFPSGQTQPNTWEVTNAVGYDISVLGYEVRSTGNTSTQPDGNGRCAPSLDVDCRFFDYFRVGSGPSFTTPTAILSSRGRALGFRVIPFAPLPSNPPSMGVKVTFPQQTAPTGGSLCAASPAVSLLRDSYVPLGHDQFQFDNSIGFYPFDDTVREGTDTIGFTDYMAVSRNDTQYAVQLSRPDPSQITDAQLNKSLPILLSVRTLAGCGSVDDPQLADALVLTVTGLGTSPPTPTTIGTIIGDSETPLSLGSVGVAPWVFNGSQGHTNLAIDDPPLVMNNYYVICVGAKAVNNTRKIGDVCATIRVVKGPGGQ